MEEIVGELGTGLLHLTVVLGIIGILMKLVEPGQVFSNAIVNYIHSISG